MPPAMPMRLAVPRTLAAVLLDLRGARHDWMDALAEADTGDEDAIDRADQADARVDALRAEFDTLFSSATGMTISQLRDAIAAALL